MSCACIREAEHVFMLFLKTLPREDLKHMTGHEAELRLDEESEEEMKDAVWYLIRRMIRWGYALQRVKDELNITDEDSDKEEEDDAPDEEDTY